MDGPWTEQASLRWPGAVPDLGARGVDTDGDAVPDTLLTADGSDLLVQTDLDADGVMDRVLRIGLDGAVHVEAPSVDEQVVGRGAGWQGLLGEIVGPDN